MATSRKLLKKQSEESHQMSLLEEHPVQPLVLQDLGKDLMKIEETSHLSLLNLFKEQIPHGLFGKMSLESCHLTKEKTLQPSSEHWQNTTLSTSYPSKTKAFVRCRTY